MCDKPRYSTMGRWSRDGGSARGEGVLPWEREARPDPVRHFDPSTIGCRSAGELETVKKGTPLYGQPSWWGEDTETNVAEERRVEGTRSSRPASLVVVDAGEERPVPHSRGVYMEIPHHSDTTPERDKPPLRDKTTPSRSSSSSISKDSLHSALSPDRDGSLPGGGGEAAPPANPALTFTIDFSDDDRRKTRLQSGASLSQFVPPKIRRSLAEHVRSSATTTTTATSSEKVSAPPSVVSSGKSSVKNSEERDPSPARQKRLDDLWGTAPPDLAATTSIITPTTSNAPSSKPPTFPQQGRPSRKSSERATGVPSLRTADFTEVSNVVPLASAVPADGTCEREGVVGREGRREPVKRVKEQDIDLQKKPPRSPRTQDARKSSPRSRITRTRPAGSTTTTTVNTTTTTSAVLATSVPASAYSSTTEYLLDRMFAGEAAQESPRSDGRDSPVATEHVMYREARDFERAAQRGSSGGGGTTYRAGDKPPVGFRAKPPSKSPAPGPGVPRTSSSSASSSSTTPRSPKTLKPSVEMATAPKRISGVAAPAAASPVASALKATAAAKPSLEKTATTSPVDGELERPLRASRTPPSSLNRASRSPPLAPAVVARASRVTPPPQPSTLAARPTPAHLPVAPSPVSDPDPEDKVSEAGTYTIEAEQEDAEEELRARQQIDQVFGVTDLECFAFERPVVGSLGPGVWRRGEPEGKDGEVELQGEEEDVDTTLHDDEVAVEPGNHTPCDDDSSEVFDDEENEEQAMSAGCGEEEVPNWITQLNALTAAAIRRSPPTAMTDDDNQKRSSQAGLSRKRPGTGRKLPSIPLPGSVQSPAGSDNSPSFHDSSPDLAASSGMTAAGRVNGHGHSMTESPSGSMTFTAAVASGKSQVLGAETPTSSDLSARRDSQKGFSVASARSRGSLDTEVLLRDTETVMAAMEARMFVQRHDTARQIADIYGGQEGDSDTDLSSTVAMVNGDDDFVKPSKYHSPRDSLTAKTKNRGNSNNVLTNSNNVLTNSQLSNNALTNSQLPPTSTSSSVKRSLNRSYSEHKPALRTPHSAGTGISVLSDVLSRENSLDQSFQSDASDACSDRTDGSSTRQSSRGKGTITNTKPNRAFTLRRARADGSDAVSESSRSRTSAMSSTSTAPTSATTRRSSSMHGTSRTTYTDRTVGRSEASLGAQIAKKAQENVRTPVKARDGSVPRIMDATAARQSNRRNSGDFRMVTPNSSLSSSASLSTSSSKKDRDIRSLKTKLKIAPGVSRELAITGIASRSQSQPGSRSNSPKAAERIAWKRRKEYDPRKAVAEAKEKERKTARPPKAQSSVFSSKQKMIRSASFTNTLELSSARKRHDTYSMESNSSVEDLSSAATATDSSCVDFAFRRAFMPVTSTMRCDRQSHSADEDESGTFPISKDMGTVATALGKRPLATLPTYTLTLKSAFTPPLSKLTPSPDSPIPTAASLILRRRTLGGSDIDESGASTAPVSHRTQADSYRNLTNSPQSYDSLIVSSIYQLSLKLKTSSDKVLKKLREQNRVSITPSPIDDFLGHSAKNEIPAWKSANQELAGVLKNLRKMEHHIHLIERVLFPEEEAENDVSGMSSMERHKYYQEIERIRSELAGFQPIDSPRAAVPVNQDPASPEMDELTGQMF